MANADSTQNTTRVNDEGEINPLISAFPEDTLAACSQVLAFLAMYRAEDCPGEDEKMGMSLVHFVVKKALDYEIHRVGELRNTIN
jgi:hypothetical protein